MEWKGTEDDGSEYEYTLAIHAAGDAVPMGRPLEPRHLAALKGVRLRLDDREGREGEDGASNS